MRFLKPEGAGVRDGPSAAPIVKAADNLFEPRQKETLTFSPGLVVHTN
jgi:hypothetical protein